MKIYVQHSIKVDAWEVELVNCEKIKRDKYRGREVFKKVKDKKYLGDVISSNGTNRANIKQRTNKAHGNVNRIVTTLNERPYGKHFIKADKVMRESVLLGGLLTNGWINVLKKDIEDLEKT